MIKQQLRFMSKNPLDSESELAHLAITSLEPLQQRFQPREDLLERLQNLLTNLEDIFSRDNEARWRRWTDDLFEDFTQAEEHLRKGI